MVKNLGATHVFDYNDPAVIDNIKNAASDLEYTFDTIGSKDSSAQASQAIRSEGGVLCTVRPGKANTENVAKHVKITDVLVWTAFLKDHQYKEFKWPVGVTRQKISKCEKCTDERITGFRGGSRTQCGVVRKTSLLVGEWYHQAQ